MKITHDRKKHTRVNRLLAIAARRDASKRSGWREREAAKRREEEAAIDLPPALEWRCECGHVEPVELFIPPTPEGAVQECSECEDGMAVAVQS